LAITLAQKNNDDEGVRQYQELFQKI
jgi:hypothetical protein